jgi:hypothetical protein
MKILHIRRPATHDFARGGVKRAGCHHALYPVVFVIADPAVYGIFAARSIEI